MEKSSGTKEELLEEISDLKSKIRKLEKSQSQHKPSDMALHASEQKFRQLAEDMPALICTFLPDSTLTYVNAAYCKLFSKRPDELVGQKFVDFLPDDATREKVKHQYMSLTPENSVKTYEHKVIVADGTGKAHWHRWTDHAFFKDNGEISHFQSIGQDITESKKAADALKESELKYRSYIENAPNGVFIADENGRYLQVNPAACRITGYSDKELLSMSILDLVPPESRETAGNHFRQVVETGYAQGEFPFLHKQYPGRYWSVEAIRLSATHFMGFVQDITERKQAEAQSKATLEALRQSEASLAEAQCIARIGSWDWDMISNTVKWSKEMYRIFGIRPDEYDGNPESLLKVIHPDDVERLTSIVKSNSLTGNPISLEFRLIHKSGSIHHIFAACRVEFNDEGRPIRNIGTAQDFTERKRAESQREAALDALQESELFVRTLLDSIPIPVFYKDRDGRYLGFNKAFETFFGDTKEKLIGKTVFDINPPDLAAIYHARDAELFKSGGAQQYTSQVKNVLGSMREVIFNKAVFTNSHGAISGQIGTVLDITEHKQAEEALQKSDLLSRLVLENINDIVWTFDLSSMTYTFVSPSAQHILGYTADETTGVSLDFIFTPETKHSVMKIFGKLLAGKVDGNRLVTEAEHRKKDGSLIMMEISASPFKDDLGNIVGLLGVSRDITARKQTEEVLRESEERYRAITEYSHNAICIVDEQAKISWVNSVMVAMSGYTPEQLYAVESFADFLAPESIEFVVSNFYKVLEAKPYEHHYNFYVIRADGEKRLFEKHMMDFKDKSGKLNLIISMMDITERKQMEEVLQASEARFQSLFNNMSGGVAVYKTIDNGEHFIFVDMNKGGEKLSQVSKANIIGKIVEEVLPGIKEMGLLEVFKQVWQTGVPQQHPVSLYHDNHHAQWFENYVYKLPSGEIVAVYDDVTERKQAESHQHLTAKIMRILNDTSSLADSIKLIMAAIKQQTGLEAVGIRLHAGEDFPYYETNGFPDYFVQMENNLCPRDEAGAIMRDGEGNPLLECMCGNILCGRTNTALPFFTEGGSFWSNCTTELLASTTEADRQAHTRNRCNGEGYESVALIPLRTGKEIIGLLQFDDHRRNQFTLEMIQFFESLSDSIGIALSRRQAEKAMRVSEENFHRSLDESPLGVRVVTVEGETLYANRAILDIYGYESIEELATIPVVKRYNPASYAEYKTRWEKRKRGDDVPADYTIDIIRKDGEVRHLQVYRKEIFWNGARQDQAIYQDITARKQAEQEKLSLIEKIEKERDYTSNIIQSMMDMLIVLEPDGTIKSINQVTENILKYSSNELLGKNIGTIVEAAAAAAADREESFITSLTKQGLIGQVEKIYLAKDGSKIPVLFSGSVMRDISGKVEGIVCVARDITESKRAEEAVLLSEENYRFQFLNMNSYNSLYEVVTDKDGMPYDFRFIMVNYAYEKYVGKKASELIGKTLLEVYPKTEQYWIDKMTEAVLTGLPIHFQNYSQEMNTYTEINLYTPKKGQLAITTANITERKQAEELLHESEIRYRDLVENINDIFFILDKDGNITYVNQPIKTAIGYAPEELIGHSFSKIIYSEDLAVIIEAFSSVLSGILSPSEYRIITKSGDIRWIRSSSRPVCINGVIAGIRGVATDITDSKLAEEEKQALEERLSRAEKMEALGLLAGGVAHDLNNVLGIVVGYAEMLLSEVDKESPLRDDVVTIMDGGQRAAAIVEDMLAIARRGVSNRKILNLNKLIGDCKKLPDWQKLLSRHPNVKIKTELETDLLNISGSSVHLTKTLYNLVSNAAEAMTQGGTLTIKTTNQYIDKPIPGYDTIREGDYVVLSVSDEGEGISETDLKRIFEPFYTKKIMGRSGTGLGLSVVWGTVKDHQGYIDVQSEENKGTKFTLYFQITREEIAADDIAVSLSEYMGKGQSILVVDDVKKQRDLASRMLKSLNYNVMSAASGEDAVEYLKDHKIDLLVLDMIMDPGMDGLDTYKSVLKIHPKQKAIIVSGFSESDRVHDVQALGAGAYVKKPYVIEKLGLAVKKALGKKR